MPTLDWIGKKAVINHHNEVPFHLLKEEPSLSVGDPESGNLLVQGDNLLALKALLPYYAGQVKCIYIDPPYNTGNENWVYNDNVNSPEIRKWLGKVVGGELEDLSRHDKWLCMMYPRLILLRQMLSEDGSLWISIDDSECHNLKMVLDEIFGKSNFFGSITWQHSIQGKNDAKQLSIHHNYLLVYQKSNEFIRNKVGRTEENNVNYSNRDNDPKGPWRSGDVRSPNLRENLRYVVTTPSGKKIKSPEKGWRWSKKIFNAKVETGEITFTNNETKVLRKIYLADQEGRVPESIWFGQDVGTTREANQEMKDLFGDIKVFDTPKPTSLLKRVMEIATNEKSIILDSFAGSGTTGHAVAQLNKKDGGNRHFILVEMDEKICRDVTAERIKRVIKGYKKGNEKIAGFGGGVQFCKLGSLCFDEKGRINPEVKFTDLARHVFFAETGIAIGKCPKADSPLIGIQQEIAVYLLYNGILKDKAPKGGNVLTKAVLEDLPKHKGPKIIYGTACRLGKTFLKQREIVFRQIPYEIRVK